MHNAVSNIILNTDLLCKSTHVFNYYCFILYLCMFNILNYYKIILKANKKHKCVYAFNLCFKFYQHFSTLTPPEKGSTLVASQVSIHCNSYLILYIVLLIVFFLMMHLVLVYYFPD